MLDEWMLHVTVNAGSINRGMHFFMLKRCGSVGRPWAGMVGTAGGRVVYPGTVPLPVYPTRCTSPRYTHRTTATAPATSTPTERHAVGLCWQR